MRILKTALIVSFFAFSSSAIANHFISEPEARRLNRWNDPPFNIGEAVIATKQIHIPQYPQAFNPSIHKISQGFLLVFRNCPNLQKLWIADLGIVVLDENLDPISEPVLLSIRKTGDIIPPQGEDARIFEHNGKLYLIYNDNMDVECPSIFERRDMHIAELSYKNGQLILSDPIMLFHEKKYDKVNWQKNWVPFSYKDSILLSYSLLPHEILCPDFSTGACEVCFETVSKVSWNWGTLRGGTPAILVNGEYLAFFHSSTITKSTASRGKDMWHYYMGAYTFSAEPPFEITKMTSSPIVGEGFYTYSSFHKRVIFPGGFTMISDSLMYLSYGKDDGEVWIATIDYDKLKQTMKSVR